MKGFEPLASYTRNKRSTKLSYILKRYPFLVLFYSTAFLWKVKQFFNPAEPYRYKAGNNGPSERSDPRDFLFR